MRKSQRIRIQIVLVAFVLLTTLMMITTAFSLPLRLTAFTDTPVEKFTKRFTAMKKNLPASSVFGYVSDSGGKIDLSNPQALAEFYLTQYALSPLLVTNSLKPLYIIGNFHKNPTPLLQSHRLVIVRRYDNGLLLLRSTKK